MYQYLSQMWNDENNIEPFVYDYLLYRCIIFCYFALRITEFFFEKEMWFYETIKTNRKGI